MPRTIDGVAVTNLNAWIILSSSIKVRDMLRRLADDGWVIVRQRGSHRQLKHPSKEGTITVPGHPADALKPGTYKNILSQAGLEDRR